MLGLLISALSPFCHRGELHGAELVGPHVTDVIGDAVQLPAREVAFILDGYCQLEEILDFKLGPSRGQAVAYAAAMISDVNEANGVRCMVLGTV